MEYTKIINEIKNLENEEMTIEKFRIAGRIKKEMDRLFIRDVFEKKVDAEYQFDNAREMLETMIFQQLKEKLGFEDEVITKMVYFLDFAERLEDIYVLDGLVMVKVISSAYHKPTLVSYLAPSQGINEITSAYFNNSFNYPIKNLLVGALNNVLNPLFKDYLNGDDVLLLENGNLIYNLPQLSIYFDKSIKEIEQINKENINSTVKILVKYGVEELYSYDLKIRNGYAILSENDFQVKKVSEMLDTKKMVKKI